MNRESEALFSTPAMSAVFSDEARAEALLRFEAALARATAHAGLIPHDAADAITRAATLESIDLDVLFHESADSATAVVPLVRMLRAAAGEAGTHVHLGATSQDVIDSATMLQVREGFALLETALFEVARTCTTLASQHRATVMSGRTLMQQAVPITFGLKAARWLAMLTRQTQRLREVRDRTVALQFGGAAGTLSALGDAGPKVSARLAEELGLPEPDLPWHTERDRIAEIASLLGTIAGATSKIAGDIVLMAQTEVAEVAEGGEGKGRSSAMPQKRNPVEATLTLGASRLALGHVPTLLAGMAQAHERAVGEWQTEWTLLPDLFRHTAGALAHLHTSLATLQVYPDRMRANLDATSGAVMAESLAAALTPSLGRAAAQHLVEGAVLEAIERGTTLAETARARPEITAALDDAALKGALDPLHYLGANDLFIDRALAGFRALEAGE